MTEEEQTLKIEQLEKDLKELKDLFYKDNYSNLQIFRKQIQFKGGLEIDTISKTNGTAPIADGAKVCTVPDAGATITITTKNGIITAIAVT